MADKKKKGFFGEFKEFISRGNVVDMAVGVVVGSAFTKIVNSLVNDIINPAVGYIIGEKNFADLAIILVEANEEAGIAEVAIKYGQFIQNIVDFLIIAFVIFCLIKGMNKIRDIGKKEEAAAEEEAK